MPEVVCADPLGIPPIHIGPVDSNRSGTALVLRFRGLNYIDTSINLVLSSALLRASRRTAASEIVPAAILFETLGLRLAPQDEVRGFKLHPPDPIGFMESIY